MKKLYKLDAPADGVYEEYNSLNDALAAADEIVELWRQQARDDGEWDEEVEGITISKILFRAKINQIRFGVMSPTLAEQLDGCEYDVLEISHCQRLANAISDLWIANMLTDAEVKAARKRLGKRIFKAVSASETRSEEE